eukprot:1854334-Rhodomonas_salina.2
MRSIEDTRKDQDPLVVLSGGFASVTYTEGEKATKKKGLANEREREEREWRDRRNGEARESGTVESGRKQRVIESACHVLRGMY